MLTEPPSDLDHVMVATSRAIILDHREVMAVLVTSGVFVAAILAIAWAVV